jgi:short-subunit dehydrogenase
VYDKYADKDSYVVVTGGSDGIGLEICHQMAALGYNICMIGRNESKMQKAISEVTAKHANIKTKYVVFDFAQLTTMKDYEDKIGKAL